MRFQIPDQQDKGLRFRSEGNIVSSQIDFIKQNSLILKSVVSQQDFIERVKNESFDIMMIGQTIYEYELA